MTIFQGLSESTAFQPFVESMVVIAHGLGIRTVAEGIESAALVEPLRELGVDMGQGYLFGRPAPVVLGR